MAHALVRAEPALVPALAQEREATIAQDLRDYKKLRARGVTSFMMGRYSWYCYGPSLYVYARMAWDPAQDPDELLDEITQHQYGPAAGSIRSFWLELELGMRPFLAQGEFETLPVTADRTSGSR